MDPIGHGATMDFELSRALIYSIGEVAIHFAYLEDELDRIIELAEPLMKLPPKTSTWEDFYGWNFRGRVNYVRRQLLDVCDALAGSPGIDGVKEEIGRVLTQCAQASDQRNAILHASSVEDALLGPVVKTQKRVARPSIRATTTVTPMAATEVHNFAIWLTTIQNGVRALDPAVRDLLKITGKIRVA